MVQGAHAQGAGSIARRASLGRSSEERLEHGLEPESSTTSHSVNAGCAWGARGRRQYKRARVQAHDLGDLVFAALGSLALAQVLDKELVPDLGLHFASLLLKLMGWAASAALGAHAHARRSALHPHTQWASSEERPLLRQSALAMAKEKEGRVRLQERVCLWVCRCAV